MTTAQEQAIVPTLPKGRWPLRVARVGWLFIVLLLTAIFIASAPSAVLNEQRSWQFSDAVPAVWRYMPVVTFATIVATARLAVLTLFYAVALLIAYRKWNDWFALFVSAALLLVIWGFGARSEISTYVFPGLLAPLEPALSSLLSAAFIFSWILLFFLLPDGRFVPRWAGWLVLLILPGFLLLIFSGSSYTSIIPLQYRQRVAELAWNIFFIDILVLIVAGLISQLHRYRNVATPVQRQQMKWILIGLAAQPLPLLFGISGMGGKWGAVGALFIPLFIVALLPITIGLAVFRRRLWDADPLINRTLVYGGLTLLVLVLYVAIVGVAYYLSGETSNLFLAALAVGVAALLAQPIRARLQRLVNRLMYGDRDDPATVLARLADRLATAAAPAETLPLLVETIAQALRLPYVAIEATEEEPVTLAATGRPQLSLLRLPLIYQSAPVGELLIASRSPDEIFSPAERRLLDNIARQAGAAVYAAQLTGHLQRSREQLVLAREEERRRLQRDLHDSLGPQLAALGMQLDVARGLAAAESPDAAALLARLSLETQSAIADIRRLVYDLRPPSLDQLGLAGALREYLAGQNGVTRGTRITFDAPESLPPLPAAIEVAAYRIVQEAIANCLSHAGAAECRVRLAINGGLLVEIQDDGRGLPPGTVAGVGLASMRERAAELGGECRVESALGNGTRVLAAFPLPEATRS